MAWTIEVSAAAEQDIALIFDFLTESYIGFGEAPASAAEHATDRIGKILDAMERIATAPYRGTHSTRPSAFWRFVMVVRIISGRCCCDCCASSPNDPAGQGDLSRRSDVSEQGFHVLRVTKMGLFVNI